MKEKKEKAEKDQNQDKILAMQKFVELSKLVQRAIEQLTIMDTAIRQLMGNLPSPLPAVSLPLILKDEEYRRKITQNVINLLNFALAVVSDNLGSAMQAEELMKKIRETDALVQSISKSTTHEADKTLTGLFGKDLGHHLYNMIQEIIDQAVKEAKKQSKSEESEIRKRAARLLYDKLVSELLDIGWHVHYGTTGYRL